MSRTKLTQNSIAAGALNANTMFAADVISPHAIANTSTYSVNELLVGGTILLDNTGNIQINNGGTIGSTSDADAITIASNGVITMNQIPVLSAGLNVSGGTIAGTLSTAAQGNITSLGTLSALTVSGLTTSGTMKATSRLFIGDIATSVSVSEGQQNWTQSHDASNRSGATWFSTHNSAGGAETVFAKGRSGSIGSYTIAQSGDTIGTLSWCGDDGTNMNSVAARILGAVDGTPGENDMPGRLVFLTTADGASSPSERMRITQAGLVGIGNTAPGEKLEVTGAINFNGAATSNAANSGKLTYESAGAYLQSRGADASTRGKITLYQAASDGSSGLATLVLTAAGIMEVTKDQDIDHDIGRATIGTFAQDWANFSHIDHSGAASAGFRQSAAGKTEINTPTGQSIAFRIGNVDKLIMDANGHLTCASQSSFYATCAAKTNVTGNQETTYIVGASGYTWTEVQDRNADFDGAGLFTAPVAGFYHMSGTMQFSGLNSANSGVAYLIVSNGNIQILHNPTSIANVSTNYNINISQVVFMDANDTAQIAMYINGAGSAVCDLDSAQFSGYLLG